MAKEKPRRDTKKKPQKTAKEKKQAKLEKKRKKQALSQREISASMAAPPTRSVSANKQDESVEGQDSPSNWSSEFISLHRSST